MQEFSSVTASSYDADSLAPMLAEKSAEGWSVISIVAAGTNIVAYLQREDDGSSTEAEDATGETAAAAIGTDAAVEDTEEDAGSADDPASFEAVGGGGAALVTDEPAAVAEPAGWAVAPESDTPADPAADESAVDESAQPEPAEPPVAEPAVAEPAVVEPAAQPAVPAGWYADPSTRFELRYWDGSAWTEHVSHAGQQFTDPPVA